MNDARVTIAADQKQELIELVRRLPGILSGRVPDEKGIAAGFRSRIGFTILSLIGPNFEELGRGQVGADGTKWPPLTRAYLAYGRRFGKGEQAQLKRDAGLTRAHRFGVAGQTGVLNKAQQKLWNQVYSHHLRRLVMRMDTNLAKAAAGGIAWNAVKAAGGKTKLEVFGNRSVQILVDTGRLRGSLQPGTLTEDRVYAQYNKPTGFGAPDQIFDVDDPVKIVVGTNVTYAAAHHDAKGKRLKWKRRLWPESFPADWWRQILGSAISGLERITDLFQYR